MAIYNFPENPNNGDIWQHPDTLVIYQFVGSRWKANNQSAVNDTFVNQTGDVMTGDLRITNMQGVGSALVSVSADGKLMRGGVDEADGPYLHNTGDFVVGNLEFGPSAGVSNIALNTTGDASFSRHVSLGLNPTADSHAVPLGYLNTQLNNLAFDYLSLSGGNLSDDLTIASNSIRLSSNGDGIFTGNITAASAELTGEITSTHAGSDDIVLRSYLDGVDRFVLYADGRIAARDIVLSAGITITNDNQLTTKTYVDTTIDAKISDQLAGSTRYLASGGDNMTGNLTIASDKIVLKTNGDAEIEGKVTASEFDGTLVGDGSQITNIQIVNVQDAPPQVNLHNPGSLWWNSNPNDGQLYVLYEDADSKQWVQTNPVRDWFTGVHYFDAIFKGNLDVSGTAVFANRNMAIRSNGDVENANNSYGGLSDRKLKTNISTIKSQWNDIKRVRLVNFEFKQSVNLPSGKQMGVISQELKRICPSLVTSHADTSIKKVPMFNDRGLPVLDESGNQKMKEVTQKTGSKTESVKYSVLYLKALGALQECMSRIEQLESEVKTLKGE